MARWQNPPAGTMPVVSSSLSPGVNQGPSSPTVVKKVDYSRKTIVSLS